MLGSDAQQSDSKAFTLVELLIVVIVLGLLAAIVIPRFSNIGAVARQSMLADNLRITRTQMAVFRAQHFGVAPGYPACDTDNAPSQDVLIEHMTRSSDAGGDTADPGTPGYKYGPYMLELMQNPVNGKATVEIIGDGEAFPEAGDDSHGFMYKPATLTFKADSPGADEGGKPFSEY